MVASTSFVAAKMAVVKISSFIASTDPPSSVAVESTFATIMVVASQSVVVLEEPSSGLLPELVFTLRVSF